eukprot:7181810-Lingulodinium_polyedra.AAC.1
MLRSWPMMLQLSTYAAPSSGAASRPGGAAGGSDPAAPAGASRDAPGRPSSTSWCGARPQCRSADRST